MQLPRLVTVGVIATQYGCSVTRVRYVLAKRPDIRATATAGNTRLFDRAAVDAVLAELARIDARCPDRGQGVRQ